MQNYLVSIFAALGLAAPTGALADDIQSTGFAEPTIVFHGGVGIVAIRANEYVYEDDAKVSQLIWESTAPVVRVDWSRAATMGGRWPWTAPLPQPATAG